MCASSPNQVNGLGRPCPPQVLKKLVSPLSPSCLAQASRQGHFNSATEKLNSRPIYLLLRDQRPENARVLVGQRDARSGRSQSLLFVVDPAAATVDLGLGPIDHRPGSMHQ